MNTDEALFKNKKKGHHYREPNVVVNLLIASSVHILIFFCFFFLSISLSLEKVL